MTRAFIIRPVDAWFFRDGRPYNQSEANQTGVVSLFPPHAPTVLGALRAAFARANGWNRGPSWTGVPSLKDILGDGPDDLGTLRFRGPYLAHRTQDATYELLWPLPAHVLGTHATPHASSTKAWQPNTLLTPSPEPVPSDLGDVHVPVPARFARDRTDGKKPGGAAHAWVTGTGLGAILHGQLPGADQVLPASALWRHEPRVGIVRHEETRTTGPNAMYSPLMVRLQRDIALVAELSGVPASWNPPDAYIPLGGESRLATCATPAPSLSMPEPPSEQIRRTRRVVVVHLSPARFAALPAPGQLMPDVPGARVVCACLPPPVPIGGWSNIRRGPIALTLHVAPGSVWFCQIEDDAVDRVLGLHHTHIGEQRDHGFGHIALGAWPAPRGDIES